MCDENKIPNKETLEAMEELENGGGTTMSTEEFLDENDLNLEEDD